MPAVYATLSERLSAAALDGLVWLGWLVALLFVPWPAEIPGGVKLALWLVPPLLGEPLLVAFDRASPGQRARGLRVAARPGRRFPGLPKLLGRQLVKLLCGGASMLYVPFAPRSESLHDRLFGTVVVHHGRPQPVAPLRPKRGSIRRLMVAILWIFGGFAISTLVLAVLLALLAPDVDRLRGDEAATVEALTTLVLLFVQAPILYLAFSARLPGTRVPRDAGAAGIGP